MGLAVLPARLKNEMELLSKTLISGGISAIRNDEILSKHADWVEEFSKRNNVTAENVDDVIKKEIGSVFENVLADAGVFKRNDAGISAFKKFTESL